MRAGLCLELVPLGQGSVELLPHDCRLTDFFLCLLQLTRGRGFPCRAGSEFPPDLFPLHASAPQGVLSAHRVRRQERRWRAERKGTGRLCLVTRTLKVCWQYLQDSRRPKCFLADSEGVPALGTRHVDGFTHGRAPGLSLAEWVPDTASTTLQSTDPRRRTTIPHATTIRRFPTCCPSRPTFQKRTQPLESARQPQAPRSGFRLIAS